MGFRLLIDPTKVFNLCSTYWTKYLTCEHCIMNIELVNIALLEKRVEQVPPEMLNAKVSMMQHNGGCEDWEPWFGPTCRKAPDSCRLDRCEAKPTSISRPKSGCPRSSTCCGLRYLCLRTACVTFSTWIF